MENYLRVFLGFTKVIGEILNISPIWVGFALGVMVTSLLAAGVGRYAMRARVWKSTADAAHQLQQFQTPQTPYQVVKQSKTARRKLLGCRVLMLLGTVGIISVMLWQVIK